MHQIENLSSIALSDLRSKLAEIPDSTGQLPKSREVESVATALLWQLMSDPLFTERAQEQLDELRYGGQRRSA